jgi:hypothetical protein
MAEVPSVQVEGTQKSSIVQRDIPENGMMNDVRRHVNISIPVLGYLSLS